MNRCIECSLPTIGEASTCENATSPGTHEAGIPTYPAAGAPVGLIRATGWQPSDRQAC